ncbi:YheC/YheD family protein [Paenibacillus sp. F411]|uniref:YheC/YheD family protein n=1 Tax=Paenibacillus sp. F411 TaxID=2820239 RepID=UPI001AB00DD4|nr:YheC/YheD family protein [Paenibacillus sp. F411]MBO2943866.1 YheC/YheD family protein [Paenibacillus sp. F411]
MAARQLASKWLKTEALRSDPRLIPYIPETKALSPEALNSMLLKHGKVVIKPVVGTGGNGVILIQSNEKGYSVRHQRVSRHVSAFPELLRLLSRLRFRRAYLIQQGIELATIQGRPLDYRVKVVKDKGAWACRAMVGRLARRGLFVTNLCKGGTMLPGRRAIALSLPQANVPQIRKDLRALTRIGIEVMEKHFPGIGELGFDYGIDTEGRIWIFEVNTRPH